MNRAFDIGDTVLCNESGVVGTVLNFYTPTSCEEQTKVLTEDGRKYHAPTRTWVKFNEYVPKLSGMDFDGDTKLSKNMVTLKIDVEPELVEGLKIVLNQYMFAKQFNRR